MCLIAFVHETFFFLLRFSSQFSGISAAVAFNIYAFSFILYSFTLAQDQQGERCKKKPKENPTKKIKQAQITFWEKRKANYTQE